MTFRECTRCNQVLSIRDFRLAHGWRERVCLPCSREATREYLESWREIPGNRERAVSQTKDWRRKFPQKSRDGSSRYQKGHPEVQINTEHRRRAKMQDSDVSSPYIAELRKIGQCMYCGITDNRVEIEHMIPIARDGKHIKSNLTVACKPCNTEKHTMTPEEYAALRAERVS